MIKIPPAMLKRRSNSGLCGNIADKRLRNLAKSEIAQLRGTFFILYCKRNFTDDGQHFLWLKVKFHSTVDVKFV